jgi:hypothetical protein
MRYLVPIGLAGALIGFAVCDAWALALVTLVAAFVAYGVARSVAQRENLK